MIKIGGVYVKMLSGVNSARPGCVEQKPGDEETVPCPQV
jgi:hypothetical protein